MQIDRELILQAKEKLGDRNAALIAEELGITDFDERNLKARCPFHSEKHASFIYNPKAYNFHCFAAETRVITRNGVFNIGALAGHEAEIINGNGEWERVRFVCCGVQPLMWLELLDGTRKRLLRATPEHEWIVVGKTEKKQTKALKPGDVLASPPDNCTGKPMSRFVVYETGETNRAEYVYCCETSTHSFLLEDFILTGNCFGCGGNWDILDAFMLNGLTYAEACKKLFELAEIPYAFGELGVRTRRQYKYPKEVECSDKSLVYDYFARRKIRGVSLQRDTEGTPRSEDKASGVAHLCRDDGLQSRAVV